MDTMRFASGVSGTVSAREAAEEACRQAAAQLGDASCDLVCLFASAVYRTSWPELLADVATQLKPSTLIGCHGSGIIGGGRELEWVPALSLVAARLPGVRLFPFTVNQEEIEHSEAGGFWVDKVGVAPDAKPIFILLADPYTSQPVKLLEELNATYRGCPIIGGLASGGNGPGEHVLFRDQAIVQEGAVGVAMTGNIAVDTVVSQGARPIGRPYVVTGAEEHVVWQLGGRPALSALHEALASLSPVDRELAQRGAIVVGLAFNEMRRTFGSGDFLIRNIMGLDPETGAMAVADTVAVGQTLQFQLRDPSASRQELRRLLQQLGQLPRPAPPAGGLLFNCTGRGKALYGVSHQDVKTIQLVSGKLPIGGFFSSGEIGPVGGTNFLHGYTASLGLFRPLQPPTSAVS